MTDIVKLKMVNPKRSRRNKKIDWLTELGSTAQKTLKKLIQQISDEHAWKG